MVNTLIDTILNRKSTRSYTDKPISDEDIKTLLSAGMSAPSAMNLQPCEFLVITDKEILKGASKIHPFVKMAENAAAAIVVCGDLNKYAERFEAFKGYWVQDASAATENILLAAEALGIGAVWTGLYPVENICNKAINFFNLPENIIPLNIIVLGYPSQKTPAGDRWNPEKVHINKF